MPTPREITDQLFVRWNPDRIRQAAFNVIDRTQDEPHTQVLGTTVALVLLCETLKVDPRQLFATVESHLKDVDSPFVGTFDAVREFARNEIMRRTR